jgi:hypothetical protein
MIAPLPVGPPSIDDARRVMVERLGHADFR